MPFNDSLDEQSDNPDTDNDGLSDGWRIKFRWNNRRNIMEIDYVQTTSNGWRQIHKNDTDRFITDGWEVVYGCNPPTMG